MVSFLAHCFGCEICGVVYCKPDFRGFQYRRVCISKVVEVFGVLCFPVIFAYFELVGSLLLG